MRNRIKHKIKLVWLKRKWVLQCVYNTEEFKKAKFFLDLEKEVNKLYHKALRENDPKEIARAEGRQEIISWLKEVGVE